MKSLKRIWTKHSRAVLLSVSALLVVTIATGFLSLSTEADEPALTVGPTPVEILQVRQEPGYERRVAFSGSVEGSRRSDLGFERPGLLTRVLVKEGDSVVAGQVLAHMDDAVLQAELRRIQAALRGAMAVEEELRNGPRSESIEQAEAALAELVGEQSLARLEWLRSTTLLERGAISQSALDVSETRLRSLDARVRLAQSRLDELKSGTRPEQLAAQRSQVAGLEAQMEGLELEILKTSLRAPYAGRILARLADEGSVVSPGQTVLEIVESDALEARVGVTAEVAAGLLVGQEVELDSDRTRVSARILSVGPEVDPSTRMVTVLLKLREGSSLLPGQLVRLEVAQRIEGRGFWVPIGSLVRGTSGLWSCMGTRSDTDRHFLVRHAVEVLETDGERAFVRGTLRDGDLIVADGAHRLVEGLEVSLLSRDRQLAAGNSSVIVR